MGRHRCLMMCSSVQCSAVELSSVQCIGGQCSDHIDDHRLGFYTAAIDLTQCPPNSG